MNPRFWSNKRVFVTGHTGFKGSWLSLWLQTLGAQVCGYSLEPPTTPNLFEKINIADDMISIHADIRDLNQLRNAIKNHHSEVVFHMAAKALVRESYLDPVETYSVNVMGTVNMLEAIRQSIGVRVGVIVTSDKCYENKEWLWGYRENDPMGGHDPYSSSKGCAELVTGAYRNSFFPLHDFAQHGVALASARAGNVIGGGDWAKDRLVPDIMNALMEDRPVIIRNPGAIRPWQHVLEPLNGYLTLAERLWEDGPKFAGGWNFGPNEDDEKPVSWIVEQLSTLWGTNALWKGDSTYLPHEATYLKLDSSKAKAKLGWTPKLQLRTSLEWVAEWYQAYRSNENIRQITQTQIVRYQNIR